MKKIARFILWIVWNVASLMALPLYAIKHTLKAIAACLKEWSAERQELKESLQLCKKKEPEGKFEAVMANHT